MCILQAIKNHLRHSQRKCRPKGRINPKCGPKATSNPKRRPKAVTKSRRKPKSGPHLNSQTRAQIRGASHQPNADLSKSRILKTKCGPRQEPCFIGNADLLRPAFCSKCRSSEGRVQRKSSRANRQNFRGTIECVRSRSHDPLVRAVLSKCVCQSRHVRCLSCFMLKV